MLIKNAKVFRHGRFELSSIDFGSKIESFGADGEGYDAGGAYVVPGFVDVHTHGAVGLDASDCSAEEIPTLAKHYADHGVTSFCFTTMTISREDLKKVMGRIRGYERSGASAKCAGVHLEGPFLSYKKRGAQAAFNLQEPNIDMFMELDELSGHKIKLITVAPEIDGALPFIREASKVCNVSLGHSTATYDQAMAGFEAGANHATHLFNGMEAFHHREPGLVGAALSAGAYAELICDGIHIHPAVIRAVEKMFGDKFVIISDSLRCAGLTDGHYNLAGQEIVVRGRRATLLDGTIAGSCTNLLEELHNVVSFGIPLETAVSSMTEYAAKSIGEFDRIGSLEKGKCADLLILDEKLNLKATFIDGELVNGSLD
ncbi:MAG: N-acetylglucosamine-6-phosphate deacetylase [Candidatus Limivicinus sp.]|jgi:N-acetylglucosamine-6-phosphate deacetylase